MNLLFDRDQKQAALFSLVPLRIGSGVMFRLRAELELDEEEDALLKKYRLLYAPLVVSDPIDDLKRALRPAAFLAIVTFIVFSLLVSFSIGTTIGILVLIIMTFVYFDALREQINVNHLLNGGRTFRCESIVALIQKEAYLEAISQYLRQVLESAKYWHDREAVAIKPLSKADAKQAVLEALHGR